MRVPVAIWNAWNSHVAAAFLCNGVHYTAAMTGRKIHLIQLRVDTEFLEALDEWRAGQRPLPSRSEAIRRLVALGMKPRPGRKPKDLE